MMKKIFWTAALLLVFTCGYVTASSVNGDFGGRPIVKVTFQGKELAAEDVPAIIDNGRTVIPLYYLKQLGYDLKWDPNRYTVDIQPQKKKLSYEEISKMAQNVGFLINYKDQTPFMEGSAFAVDNGYLLSVHHVTDGFTRLDYQNNGITTFNKLDFDNARIDISGINLKSLNKALPMFKYNTQLPEIGSKVYAVGYPNEKFAITEGTVTSTDYVAGYPTITHTAFTDHGNSGGPLLNEFGEVIGVVSGGNENNSRHYAIPISFAQQEIDKLQK